MEDVNGQKRRRCELCPEHASLVVKSNVRVTLLLSGIGLIAGLLVFVLSQMVTLGKGQGEMKEQLGGLAATNISVTATLVQASLERMELRASQNVHLQQHSEGTFLPSRDAMPRDHHDPQ